MTNEVHMIIIQPTTANKPMNKSSSVDVEFKESRRRWNCGSETHVNGLMRAVESASE